MKRVALPEVVYASSENSAFKGAVGNHVQWYENGVSVDFALKKNMDERQTKK